MTGTSEDLMAGLAEELGAFGASVQHDEGVWVDIPLPGPAAGQYIGIEPGLVEPPGMVRVFAGSDESRPNDGELLAYAPVEGAARAVRAFAAQIIREAAQAAQPQGKTKTPEPDLGSSVSEAKTVYGGPGFVGMA